MESHKFILSQTPSVRAEGGGAHLLTPFFRDAIPKQRTSPHLVPVVLPMDRAYSA